MTEKEERAAVTAEALTWLRTPYHHGQRRKGCGVDCAWFVADVFANAGLIPRIEYEYYPPDWHIHGNDERYLRQVLKFGHKIRECPAPLEKGGKCPNGDCASCPVPLPGDVAMYKFGRCTAHGAIVLAWPQIVHPVIHSNVQLGEAYNPELQKAFRGIYRLRGWE